MMRRRMQNKSTSFDGSNYMTIEPLEEFTIKFTRDVKYTKDGKLWRNLKAYQTLTLSKGEFCYFKNTLQKQDRYGIVTTSGKFNLRGNCMSLIFGDNAKGKYDLSEYPGVFDQMFFRAKVVEVEKTFLPATILSHTCYRQMFQSCTSLTTAPELPATVLTEFCYNGMFDSCTSLTTAPELPATELATNCYVCLFENCSKLSYIKALFTTWPASRYTEYWVNGVASTGTFVKNPDATWDVVGKNGVPSGWTVKFDGEE